ncbi:SDR family oxidoreductase [Candidatus Pelagibacter sp. HIMB1593]|uniref:SDR family oxidoreductase n=1 Tax=Candidatus Pelagibacter sp. HIMB1593 TaxID=3413355 RepID=UPI003F84DD69
MNILVTGGCGYVGSVLIPKLLSDGHNIINIDTQWFGNYLKKNKNLKNLKLNLSNINKINLKKIDCCIHLASIANDPMAELDKNLSWETSALNTHTLMEKLIKSKVKRIIYASSGSVYGISKKNNVTEDTELKPISLYNKVKMVTERVILSYSNKIEVFIIRPATVCGYSPRMRLDVAVNALTFSALNNGIIKVFGGSQIRPNIHIDDMCDLYRFFIKTKKTNSGIYNAGFENKSIIQIANDIKKEIASKTQIIKNLSDPRSYKLNSSKLIKIGFVPKKNIKNAIIELKNSYYQSILKQKPNFHSLKWLKTILKKI